MDNKTTQVAKETEWLGVAKICEMTGIPKRTVQRYLKEKIFPSAKQVGPYENSPFKALRSDVETYIEQYGIRDDQ